MKILAKENHIGGAAPKSAVKGGGIMTSENGVDQILIKTSGNISLGGGANMKSVASFKREL